ncbi:hypothetical protein HDV05_002693 [Chytridiales sp. JEL 0842]|nr:hypothetical protein HDV05_002693 [Chytridiales sp. JEL 0842]
MTPSSTSSSTIPSRTSSSSMRSSLKLSPSLAAVAVCMFLALSSTVIPAVNATTLTYRMAPHEKACFYTNANKANEKIAFYFAVQSGGNFDIDYEVLGPDNDIILSGIAERQGDYVFAAKQRGEFSFCFSNTQSTFAEKVIDFDISAEHEIPAVPQSGYSGTGSSSTHSSSAQEAKIAKAKEDAKPMYDSANKIGNALSNFQRDQSFPINALPEMPLAVGDVSDALKNYKFPLPLPPPAAEPQTQPLPFTLSNADITSASVPIKSNDSSYQQQPKVPSPYPLTNPPMLGGQDSPPTEAHQLPTSSDGSNVTTYNADHVPGKTWTVAADEIADKAIAAALHELKEGGTEGLEPGTSATATSTETATAAPGTIPSPHSQSVITRPTADLPLRESSTPKVVSIPRPDHQATSPINKPTPAHTTTAAQPSIDQLLQDLDAAISEAQLEREIHINLRRASRIGLFAGSGKSPSRASLRVVTGEGLKNSEQSAEKGGSPRRGSAGNAEVLTSPFRTGLRVLTGEALQHQQQQKEHVVVGAENGCSSPRGILKSPSRTSLKVLTGEALQQQQQNEQGNKENTGAVKRSMDSILSPRQSSSGFTGGILKSPSRSTFQVSQAGDTSAPGSVGINSSTSGTNTFKRSIEQLASPQRSSGPTTGSSYLTKVKSTSSLPSVQESEPSLPPSLPTRPKTSMSINTTDPTTPKYFNPEDFTSNYTYPPLPSSASTLSPTSSPFSPTGSTKSVNNEIITSMRKRHSLIRKPNFDGPLPRRNTAGSIHSPSPQNQPPALLPSSTATLPRSRTVGSLSSGSSSITGSGGGQLLKRPSWSSASLVSLGYQGSEGVPPLPLNAGQIGSASFGNGPGVLNYHVGDVEQEGGTTNEGHQHQRRFTSPTSPLPSALTLSDAQVPPVPGLKLPPRSHSLNNPSLSRISSAPASSSTPTPTPTPTQGPSMSFNTSNASTLPSNPPSTTTKFVKLITDSPPLLIPHLHDILFSTLSTPLLTSNLHRYTPQTFFKPWKKVFVVLVPPETLQAADVYRDPKVADWMRRNMDDQGRRGGLYIFKRESEEDGDPQAISGMEVGPNTEFRRVSGEGKLKGGGRWVMEVKACGWIFDKSRSNSGSGGSMERVWRFMADSEEQLEIWLNALRTLVNQLKMDLDQHEYQNMWKIESNLHYPTVKMDREISENGQGCSENESRDCENPKENEVADLLNQLEGDGSEEDVEGYDD